MSEKEYSSYGVLNEELEDELIDIPQEEKVIEESKIIDVDLVEEIALEEEKKDIKEEQLEEVDLEKTNSAYHSVIDEEELEFPIIKLSKAPHSDSQNKEQTEQEEKQKQFEEETSEKFTQEYEEKSRDTSFNYYKNTGKKQERGFFAKWTIRLGKLILFLMLLPLFVAVGSIIVTGVGIYLAGVIGAVGLGAFILGLTAFMATQISGSLIALGVAVSITVISAGLLLAFLGKLVIDYCKTLWRRLKRQNIGDRGGSIK